MIDRTVELMERLLMVALQNANDLFMRMPMFVFNKTSKDKQFWKTAATRMKVVSITNDVMMLVEI